MFSLTFLVLTNIVERWGEANINVTMFLVTTYIGSNIRASTIQ